MTKINYLISLNLVALEVSSIKLGAHITIINSIFGIKLEEISPISTIVSATGAVLKL